ncbi:MAG: hypothetical protein BEU01_00185 [Marine Group III euryarchaeote CG-Epi4]|uniref:CARDB domain-containing protein n=1 Tax=Marine Group III euryarchaeote CG-Epi4 TaxID=1888998 RepID=A0A1J5UBQ8_9ARCH|nr:MAG: hypothetical protein BEU01_00185 [Marine Group III euryarchaeote CG-Epi4]
MNTNVSKSSSLQGKMMAILVVALFALSSFSAMVSASDDVDEEKEITSGITLGEALVTESEGEIQIMSESNPVSDYDGGDLPIAVSMAEGKFSPVRQDSGEAKVLLMDDDAENWMSGPWLEASHVATALNDGGYSYDVFRAGGWDGVTKELPSGNTGLSIIDDYEVLLWYGGWHNGLISSGEQAIVEDYLDGDCGSADTFCTTNRNIIVLTQKVDWFDSRSGNFENTYMHADTVGSSYMVVGGTSNPMKGVSGSIFEGKEFSTDTAGVHYLDRPCGIKPTGPEAVGAFWFDQRKGAADGHEYHAVQFPSETYAGTQTHKSFLFADEIGVFDKRSDRADFFASILSWMEVTQESTKNVDIGIGGLDIPNHVQYWRSIEAMEPVDISVTVTNFGMLPQSSTAVKLKLKNQFGQILFDSTFDTRAFPSGHPMHIEDSMQNGDSIVFTFNKTNDAHQRTYDGLDPNKARDVLFTSAGMDVLTVQVFHTGDQGSPNDFIQADVGVGKWIDTLEEAEDEIGKTGTFGDTTDNGANSFEGQNMHRTSSYDWNADGCGYFDNDEETCTANNHDVNKTVNSVYHEGKSSLAMFNTSGWYKTGANPNICEWGDDSLSDSNCPKFAMQPNQDDYYVSPAMDLSAMEEVVIGMLFTGCMESGDYFRMQISTDGVQFTNLISYSGFCPGEGSWYLWGGSNQKYQGYVLSDNYYGTDETDTVYFRIQADADGDQNTEGSRPYAGWFIDEIVFRGTEKITRDVAVGDVTVDKDFEVKPGGDSLWREANATIINAGETSWTSLGVRFTVSNLQGEDVTDFLDMSEGTISTLDGNSIYGDITKNADQKDLFTEFRCPGANTYFLTVDVIVPSGKDFFPWNNSKTVSFRVFDNFFSDDFDTGDRSDYEYTEVGRLDTGSQYNRWLIRSEGNNAYSGQYVLQYAKEGTHNDNTPTTIGGRDDSYITQDQYDRDGEGSKWQPDVNVDLRAAFKPLIMYAIKWDLAAGDRLEVRASTDFDSAQKIGGTETWTVVKTYENNCACPMFSEDKTTWILEELSLEAFEGYQTWIDFRVVTANGGGQGVLIDDIAVIGNEYRNNVDIVDVDTVRYSASGEEHDLSVTVRGIGLEDQSGVTVAARITDSNGLRVWPADRTFNFFTIPVSLAKGEDFTVDPDTAGSDWKWGSDLAPGIYRMHIQALRDDNVQVPDESPANNFKTITLVLGAALLTGEQWTMGDGWSAGSYIWDGSDDGSLTSEFFTVWNSRPFLVVEAEYELIDASVKAQVRAGNTGPWYDVKWRAADQLASLYSIPSANYTQLPLAWEGSSAFDNSTAQTFFADLGAVEELGDGSGSLQDAYIGSDMQIRLTGYRSGPSASGMFKAYYPSVFGLDDYSVDLKDISPKTQNGEPSSLTGDTVSRTYTVKVNNFGAASDSGVVDFVLTAPDNSFVELYDGTMAIMDSVLQTGRDTYVAIKPISGSWGNGRDDLSGGDQTAYINSDGQIGWPSGNVDTGQPTGWEISNPTKTSWNSVDGKPMEPSAANFVSPGQVMTVNIDVSIGYAQWAPPGTYSIQADARSWSDYDNTFTSGDSDGQATMIIAKPDLSIGSDVRYISHATGYGESGAGWVKKTGCVNNPAANNPCETDEYFRFMFQVENTGTETVGTFRVGLLDFESNPLGVQVGLYWTSSGWAIDNTKTTAYGAEIVQLGNKKYIAFGALASELGMSAGPGDDSTGSYDFYLAVDTEDTVSESNENNNRYPVTVTAVKEVNTVPSFGLSLLSMSISGLLAAIGIALRQKEE